MLLILFDGDLYNFNVETSFILKENICTVVVTGWRTDREDGVRSAEQGEHNQGSHNTKPASISPGMTPYHTEKDR